MQCFLFLILNKQTLIHAFNIENSSFNESNSILKLNLELYYKFYYLLKFELHNVDSCLNIIVVHQKYTT